MNAHSLILSLRGLTLVFIGIATCSAYSARKPEEVAPLSPAGQALEAQYAARLERLRSELVERIPDMGDEMADFRSAREQEAASEAELKAAEAELHAVRQAKPLLRHRQAWIGRATKGVAEAKAALERAQALTGDAEAKARSVAEAEAALAKIQENYDWAARELKISEEAVERAKTEEPRLAKRVESLREKLATAQNEVLKALEGLDLELLASDALDARLAEFVILRDATPRGLAEFAAASERDVRLVERLLADPALARDMLVAGGATDGRYGRTMEILAAIEQARRAADDVLRRLALAVALEHASPIRQTNPQNQTDAPENVDPVKRYLHFERAYLDDELDSAFGELDVWDYRKVVNGDESEEALAWGREMLRNYRPDHITNPDFRWRYVGAVRTDIRYGSQDNKFDQPDLHKYQNILKNGGVCGRRAFFGRFILRAFGVPTMPRPQTGHAALAHWTPEGWVVCLGAGWGHGWVKGREIRDLDFLEESQAREFPEVYLRVKRAQWIGDVMGEERKHGFRSGKRPPEFWYGVSFYLQRAIIAGSDLVTLAAVGEDLGEANESKTKEPVRDVAITDADRTITVAADGTITIPAVACTRPTKSTGKILMMDSALGGKQLHYSRTGRHQPFEYQVEAPAAGEYALTARVATPSWKQSLRLSVNGAEPIEIELPYTIGMWETTEPVMVKLTKGANTLKFTREGDVKGVTIRDYTLEPQ